MSKKKSFVVGAIYRWAPTLNPKESMYAVDADTYHTVALGGREDMWTRRARYTKIQFGENVVVIEALSAVRYNDIKVLTQAGEVGWIRTSKQFFKDWILVRGP